MPHPDAERGSATVAIATGRHARVPLMIGANSGEDSLLSHGDGIKKAMAQVKPDLMKMLHKLYGPGLSDEVVVRDYLRDALVTAPARWVVANWSATEALQKTNAWLTQYGDKIGAIWSANDEMALAAVEALRML